MVVDMFFYRPEPWSLFRSGKSYRYSGGSQSSESESKSYTPEQRRWLSSVLDIYGPTAGQGQQSFQGDRVAPMTSTQSSALDGLGAYLDTFSAQRDMPLFGETGQTLEGILSGQIGPQPLSMDQANQTFSQSYVNPALRNFRQNTSPLIQEQFAGPGFWSTARANAVGDAASDLGAQLEAQRAGYLWDVEQTNRQIQSDQANRALAGVPLGMQYGMQPTYQAQQNLAGRQGVFDLASRGQAQAQAEINSEIQRFLEANRLTDPENMQILLSLLGMNYSSSSSSSSGWQFNSGFSFGPSDII